MFMGSENEMVRPGSALIGGLALLWLLERSLDVSLLT